MIQFRSKSCFYYYFISTDLFINLNFAVMFLLKSSMKHYLFTIINLYRHTHSANVCIYSDEIVSNANCLRLDDPFLTCKGKKRE